jgi:hypothetical protein
MRKFANLLAALGFICGSLSAANTPRYFKEDGGTGAMYIALAPDGSYTVTAREHMLVRVEETGRWSNAGSRIAFIPKKSGASPYNAEEVSYKRHIFLALEGDTGQALQCLSRKSNRAWTRTPKSCQCTFSLKSVPLCTSSKPRRHTHSTRDPIYDSGLVPEATA